MLSDLEKSRYYLSLTQLPVNGCRPLGKDMGIFVVRVPGGLQDYLISHWVVGLLTDLGLS